MHSTALRPICSSSSFVWWLRGGDAHLCPIRINYGPAAGAATIPWCGAACGSISTRAREKGPKEGGPRGASRSIGITLFIAATYFDFPTAVAPPWRRRPDEYSRRPESHNPPPPAHPSRLFCRAGDPAARAFFVAAGHLDVAAGSSLRGRTLADLTIVRGRLETGRERGRCQAGGARCLFDDPGPMDRLAVVPLRHPQGLDGVTDGWAEFQGSCGWPLRRRVRAHDLHLIGGGFDERTGGRGSRFRDARVRVQHSRDRGGDDADCTHIQAYTT